MSPTPLPPPDYPLQFTPCYQEYIWGGDRIPRLFGRPYPAGRRCAESWELSDRPEGMSIVANGPLKGTPLDALIRAHGQALLGSRATTRFPLLIKLIDARETLSVQVHPNEATAARFGGEAKTEAWHLLAAEPGSGLYAGLIPGTDEPALRRALAGGQVPSLLNFKTAHPGDTVFMPGGRVHAIGAGCLLLEVQQNSNTTYRVYDWDRVGHDGKPRDLHVDAACRVMEWDGRDSAWMVPIPLPATGQNRGHLLVDCPFFRMERWTLTAPQAMPRAAKTFDALFAPDAALICSWPGGEARLDPGITWLLPAALDDYRLRPAASAADCIRIRPQA